MWQKLRHPERPVLNCFVMKKFCLPLFVLSAFLLSGCTNSKQSVYDEYHQAVVMLYHKYLYKVTINNNVWYLTKDGNDHYYWQKDPDKLPTGPIEAFGTGFFIDKEGRIATNKHVVNDWFNSYSKTYLSF